MRKVLKSIGIVRGSLIGLIVFALVELFAKSRLEFAARARRDSGRRVDCRDRGAIRQHPPHGRGALRHAPAGSVHALDLQGSDDGR